MLKYYDEVLDGGLAKLVRSRLGEELIVLLLLRSLRLGQLLPLGLGELLAVLVVRGQTVLVVLGVEPGVLTLLEQLVRRNLRQRLLLRSLPRRLLLLPPLLLLLLRLDLRLPLSLAAQLLRGGQLPQRAPLAIVELHAQLGQPHVADPIARLHERLRVRTGPSERPDLVSEFDDEVEHRRHRLLLRVRSAPLAAAAGDVAETDPSGGLRDAEARENHRHVPRRGLHQQRPDGVGGHRTQVLVHAADELLERFDNRGRVDVIDHRGVHPRAGRVDRGGQRALLVAPGVLLVDAVSRGASEPAKRTLDRVEKFDKRLLRDDRRLHLLESRDRVALLDRGQVHGIRPLVEEEQKPDLPGGVHLQRRADGDEVLERL
mmetsp:Transcript_3323/g.14474  ORF Transcript_3323/g.14474 Transcript_3323/m.14474 type:complete len:373 (+) Transcript_3323:1110-2228(+)